MSLDESYISNREAVLRGAEDDARRRFEDAQEQAMLESEEAEAARWSHLMQRAAAERPVCWYEDGPDRRLFAVDGDIPEQARRDAS